MGLTLAQARTTVLDHLDDDGTRWSSTQIDTALALALSQCLTDYVSAGGDRFDTVESVSSTSAGVIDMTSRDPIVMRGVAMLVGTRYFPLFQRSPEHRLLNDSVARTIQLRYVKTYTLPTDTSHPLVGSGATAAASWHVFDHWVCCKAAIFCSIKDAEDRMELAKQEASLASSVMLTAKIPSSMPFPSPAGLYSQMLGWVWLRDTQDIQIIRRA